MELPGRRPETLVGRLRVRECGLDPLAVRLRLEEVLSAMQLRPHGLGPRAIVCIRQLRDPLPGVLTLWRHGSAEAVHRWEEALAARLEEMARAASRPILGPVPAGAQAVVFADEAELLACLALDYLKVEATRQWWWQGLLQGKGVGQSLFPAWLDAPEAVPGALAHLATHGLAAQFARAMPPGVALLLVRRVLQRFALDELAAALAPILLGEQGLAESRVIAQQERVDRPVTEEMGAHRRTPTRFTSPWRPHAPESAQPELNLAERLLLGIGLMLNRSPATLRSATFCERVRKWAIETAMHHTQSGWPIRTQVRTVTRQAQPATETIGGQTSSAPPNDGADVNITSTPRRRQGRKAKQRTVAASTPGQSPPSNSIINKERYSEETHRAIPTLEARTSPPDQTSEEMPAALPTNRATDTELGGIFYLVNLLLFLEIYGDFTNPLKPGLALGPWDLLALLGKRFLGREYGGDPVWSLLARLAGRPARARPGSYFEPPTEWRLPLEWLRPFGPGGNDEWAWSSGRGRLRVWHPAGFPVLDVARSPGSVREQLQREVAPYAEVARFHLERRAVAARSGRTRLERWIGWLAQYARARLRLALGQAGGDPARALLVHRARVVETATHLDIFLNLAELPIEIRMSGLDRDAGWVPAAGRYITFHFD